MCEFYFKFLYFQNLSDLAKSAAVDCVLSPLKRLSSAITCSRLKPNFVKSVTSFSVNLSDGRTFVFGSKSD